MTEVAEKPAAEKRVVILNPRNWGLREQLRQDWVVHAEAGTRIDDVLDPQYWSHVAARMMPYARIEVLVETGEWMLELLVLNTGRNWAQVHLLHKHDLQQRAETLPAAQKHAVEWKGGQKKFCVIRLADSQVIQDGFANKQEAGVWLAHHEKVTG